LARDTAKGHDRFGAHEQMDSGGATLVDWAFQGNGGLARDRN
jgi:hypothetical protein